jgi:4'-phosphopantetheinyl transferase
MGSAPHFEWNDLREAVHVWMAFTDRLPEGWEERCFAWLSVDERARQNQLATPELRREYLATRALCRATLSRYTGVDPAAWVFAAAEGGKPAIAEPAAFASLRFSLTRTRGLTACAVTCAGEVGVDVEETSLEIDAERVARHCFSVEEQSAMNALPPDRRTAWFYEQWTLKEAYLKGRGTGLSEPPEGFAIEREADRAPRPLGDWRLSLHRPGPQHVGAVAVRAEKPSAEIPVAWYETTAF